MMMKKIASLLLSFMFLVATVGTAAASVPETGQDKLAAVEKTAYGVEQTGALADRINHLEKDFLGTHQQDSMMQRIDTLYSRMFDNAAQPSILAQMNAIEWTIMHKVSMDSIQKRVSDMELLIQGKPSEGTYKSRIDNLATFAFGSPDIPLVQMPVAANTLVRIKTVSPINAKNLKVGDAIEFQVAEDVTDNGVLIFAKGAPGEGTVKKVEQAKNFGRDAEVEIDFKTLKAVDGSTVDMVLGEESKKEMKTMAMAAGASIAGMVVLGPIGIVAGAFVNGQNIDIQPGTELYVQTLSDVQIYGIPTSNQ